MKSKNFKTITFLSAKGGTGKSSLIVNLSYLLKKQNLEILILDTNFLFPNIDTLIGANKKTKDITKLLYEDESILDFINISNENIKYISKAIPFNDLNKYKSDLIKKILKVLKKNLYNLDFLLIDTPSTLDKDTLYISTHSDRVIVITTPDITAVSNTYLLLKTLTKKSSLLPEILINKVKDKDEAIDIYEDLKNTVKKLLKTEIKFFGYLTEDKYLHNAVKKGNLPIFKIFFNSYINELKSISEKLIKEV